MHLLFFAVTLTSREDKQKASQMQGCLGGTWGMYVPDQPPRQSSREWGRDDRWALNLRLVEVLPAYELVRVSLSASKAAPQTRPWECLHGGTQSPEENTPSQGQKGFPL